MMEDRRIHKTFERWKVFVTAGFALSGVLWFAVTRADDLIRKADKVPLIEEAVLQMKINQELSEQRLSRLESRTAVVEERQNQANQLILERLDQIIKDAN